MLVVTTLLWGLSFPWMRTCQDYAGGCPEGSGLLSGLTLMALRMSLALGVLAAWQPGLFTGAGRREHVTGVVLSIPFFAGFTLQSWGIALATPALSAFITCLASAWVPLIAWAYLSLVPRAWTLAGLVVGLAGAGVLCLKTGQEGMTLGPGEALTLLSTLFFAAEILLLDRLGKKVVPARLSPSFFAATGALAWLTTLAVASHGPGVASWWHWLTEYVRDPHLLQTLVLLAVGPTALSFHWMNEYQPRVTATRAAVIYLLEPVFATVFSVILGHDRVTVSLLLGGGLVVAGNVLVEVPRWLGKVERSMR